MREGGKFVAVKVSRSLKEEIDNAKVEARMLK